MLCLLVKHPWIEWHSRLYKQNEFKSQSTEFTKFQKNTILLNQQRVGRWKSGRLKASIFHLIGKEPEPRKKTDSSGRKTAFLESFGELGRWNYLWRFAGEEWRRGGSSGGNRSQCGQLWMIGKSCTEREKEPQAWTRRSQNERVKERATEGHALNHLKWLFKNICKNTCTYRQKKICKNTYNVV